MKLSIFTLIALILGQSRIIAAEAGMPQLNPEYWLSQSFWLVIVFIALYVLIAKFFIPKIKLSIGDRERKIKDDLDEANKLKKISEDKIAEYEKLILENKNKLIKISNDTKKKLDLDIQKKRKAIETQIQNELDKAQIEINNLKKESLTSIEQVAEDIASKVVEDLTNEKINQSSVKAIVSSTSKKRIGSLL
jgi:F-type H+-transporting ATPase subunit b|tara:strand:+ start:260 stop:835 length:576 start_codon:yes stop_codon:yes gene_type:complete